MRSGKSMGSTFVTCLTEGHGREPMSAYPDMRVAHGPPHSRGPWAGWEKRMISLGYNRVAVEAA